MRNTRTRNLPRAGLGVKVGPAVSTGNGMDFLVGRLSYTFGLTGAALPNMFHTRFVSAALSEKRAGASPGHLPLKLQLYTETLPQFACALHHSLLPNGASKHGHPTNFPCHSSISGCRTGTGTKFREKV